MPWVNLAELESLAKAALSPMIFDYFASGANDEVTLRENRAAYDRISLAYRVLAGVGERTIGTTLLGVWRSSPVLVAPMAFQRLAHADGELAVARAASAVGASLVLSTLSTVAMEAVIAATTSPVWFQLYLYKDRSQTEALVHRAEAAGVEALVLTVDAPLIGRRERDVRNRFHLPAGFHAENLLGTGMEDVLERTEGSGLAQYVSEVIEPNLGWEDLAWLVGLTRLPVLVKGVCHPDDARRAIDHGVRGVIVSNHGGRQLDTAPATIEVLPGIADAIAGRVDVLVDGGIRRGTDVVKAKALGASAVLVGRPFLWGLALGGEAGVRAVFDHLHGELDLALALCGQRSFAAVDRSLIWTKGGSR
jgi:4-hydroxymandelate oxidase